jgi:hypothetical protein
MNKIVNVNFTNVYIGGIIISIGKGIHDANLCIEDSEKNSAIIKPNEKNSAVIKPITYAMYSFGGAVEGLVSGLFWPLVAFGQVSTRIFNSKS